MLYKSWELKKKLSPKVSNKKIDKLINFGLNNGACGAKLLGAGGGGFVLFMCKENMREKLISKFSKNSVVPLKISFAGTQVVYNEREFI